MDLNDRIEALRQGPDAHAADDIGILLGALNTFNAAAERLGDKGYDVELGTEPSVPGLMTLGEGPDTPLETVIFPLLTATVRREII